MSPIFLATCRTPVIEPPDDPPLAAALKAAGCHVRLRPWNRIKPAALPPGSTVLLRSTWDYHHHTEQFLEWLNALEKHNINILNPPELIRLTIDKSYLTAERPFGCSVPATVAVAADADAVTAEVRARGWRRFILKPPVSAGADGTFLLHADDTKALKSALENQSAHLLLQEFLPEIREGELSLIFFDGRFSHAVRKIPAPGDFRVQTEFGSRTVPFRPSAEVIAAGRRALENLPKLPCYARVDGVMRGAIFLLMELELIEPELFLAHGPGAAKVLAETIVRRCQTGPQRQT